MITKTFSIVRASVPDSVRRALDFGYVANVRLVINSNNNQ